MLEEPDALIRDAAKVRPGLKGNNAIHMNTATIMAAVQMLLDASHKEGCAPTVRNVEYNANVSVFVVRIEGGQA